MRFSPRVLRSPWPCVRVGVALVSLAFVPGALAQAPERSATIPVATPPAVAPALARQDLIAQPVVEQLPLAPLAQIPLVGADFPLIRTPSSPEAFGGERTRTQATLSERVASYTLRAVLDPVKHTLDGSGTLRWKNRAAIPVRTLYFHTYLNAFEGPGSTFLAEKARYGAFRSGVEMKKGEWGAIEVLAIEQGGKAATLRYVQPDGGPATDRTVLRVELAEAVAPGATVELSLKFKDQLPRVMARTGYFGSYHLVGQWYPKLGVLELAGERGALGPRWNCHEFHLHSEFYADWGSYELEVVAPKGFLVQGSGVRQGEARETSEGVVHRFVADDVHDVVFTAWDGYAPPLTGATDVPGGGRTEVTVLYPPEHQESANVALTATLDSLRYFSRTLGPYPYPHVTVVVPPHNAEESGGMEYETFFTTVASDDLPVMTRYVTIHEFGHGYFMGLLASNEFEEPFLDEGMNEYWDARMLREDPPHALTQWEKRLSLKLPLLDPFALQRLDGARRFVPDVLAQTSWRRFSSGSYGNVYARTATVFHDLEEELGAPLIEKAMKLYYARHHFRHPSAADLQASFLDAGAPPDVLQRVFGEFVYGAATLDDVLDSIEAKENVPEPGLVFEDGKRVELDEETIRKRISERRKDFTKEQKEQQEKQEKGDKAQDEGGAKKKFLPGPYSWTSAVKASRRGAWVPQVLEVKFEDGSVERLAWPADEKWRRWEFVRPSKIESATLDPDHKLLMDINKLDDGKALKPSSGASRRWTLELGALLETLFAIGGSL